MRSSRNESSNKSLWITGLIVLLLAGGAVAWLLGSGEAPATPAAETLEHSTASPEPATEFHAPAPARGEVKPIEIGPVVTRPRQDAPAVAAGGPVGCLEGHAVNSANMPIEGVRITLFVGNALLSGTFPGARQAVDVTAITGPDGAFSLCDVPVARNYVIVGEHDDYARSEANGFSVEKDSVTSGAVLHMAEGAVIRGIVSQLGGGPLPGARVELYYTLDMAFLKPEEQRPAQVVFTDGQGRYGFTHISAASLRINALYEGFASQSRNINYALEPVPRDQEVNFELDVGASLPGRVVSNDGVAIEGARVEVTSLAKDYQGSAVAISDDGGYFILDGMSRDTYQLHCSAEGYSEKIVPAVDISAGNYNVVMNRQGSVTGWVTNIANVPVRKFSLFLMRAHISGEANYLNDSRSFDSADGKFSYDGIDPGSYVLEARASDFADTRSEVFTIELGMTQPPQVRIHMLRGGTICGHVYDSSGAPLARALITLNANNFIDSSINKLFKAFAPSDEPERKLRAGDDGSYCIDHISPGTYQIVAEHESAASRVLNDVVVVDEDAGGNNAVDLTLPRGSVIQGRAVDSSSGPLSFCKVQINLKDNTYMDAGTTNRDGYFNFPNLREGSYQITVSPDRVNDQPVHPFLKLVYASKSMQEVYVGEGQVVDGVLVTLRDK